MMSIVSCAAPRVFPLAVRVEEDETDDVFRTTVAGS